jgi:lipopolysaccharide export system protein LptA
MKRMARSLLIAAALAVTGVGASAQSADPVSALKGHNVNAPVDVSAERIEVQDRADRAIFAGSVHVRQGDLTLDAPRVTVAYSSSGAIQIDRIDASGGVLVKSPSETARGNFGIYDTGRKLVTLIGDVQLSRGGSQING